MSRPILARKDTKAEEAAQRRAVIARDGNVCQFERARAIESRIAGRPIPEVTWVPCCSKACLPDDTAARKTFELTGESISPRDRAIWCGVWGAGPCAIEPA